MEKSWFYNARTVYWTALNPGNRFGIIYNMKANNIGIEGGKAGFIARVNVKCGDMLTPAIFEEIKNGVFRSEEYKEKIMPFLIEELGLTPEEFYGYATTGIYPLNSYFGVPASEMMAVGDIKKVRRAYADEEARKRRESTAKKRDEKRLIEPEKIIYRDQMMLRRLIDRWKKSETTATKQIENLKEIFEQTKKALSYVVRLPKEKAEELKDPLAWRNYEELSYVFAMNELF